MKNTQDILAHGSRALRLLDRDGFPHPYADVDDQRRTQASRTLRRAVGGAVTDLDVDVVKDLMKVVKKLRTKEKENGREFDRLKLALELLEFTIDKKKPTSPDHIVWMFNRIYGKLGWVTKHEDLAKQAVDSIWYQR